MRMLPDNSRCIKSPLMYSTWWGVTCHITKRCRIFRTCDSPQIFYWSSIFSIKWLSLWLSDFPWVGGRWRWTWVGSTHRDTSVWDTSVRGASYSLPFESSCQWAITFASHSFVAQGNLTWVSTDPLIECCETLVLWCLYLASFRSMA